MSMDVWRREDVRNHLQAIWLAHVASYQMSGESFEDFHAGFRAALHAVGASFGVEMALDDRPPKMLTVEGRDA